jgi:hypothetical protein
LSHADGAADLHVVFPKLELDLRARVSVVNDHTSHGQLGKVMATSRPDSVW